MTKPLFSFDELVLSPDLLGYSREYEEMIYEEMRLNDLVESQATQWRLNAGGYYVGLIIGGKNV